MFNFVIFKMENRQKRQPATEESGHGPQRITKKI